MRSVSEAIKYYMKEKNIDSCELALRCGWDESRISAVLGGNFPINSVDFGVICAALGVKCSAIYYVSKGINMF